MKFMKNFVFILLFLNSFQLQAEDLREVVSLSGTWMFSIGDDLKWSDPGYNDGNWDRIPVPGDWEDCGYSDYNGYAWYRKSFSINQLPKGYPLYLVLGRIDDTDEVYLNGKRLAGSGSFPPDFVTAYDTDRKYLIPAGMLKSGGNNTVAIRVYDSFLAGGIVSGSPGIFADADAGYLDVSLQGRWRFQTGDDRLWKTPGFDDSSWQKIQVPADWENQGHSGYDGYGWYRVKIRVPSALLSETLYLSLGKIDDVDEVYLNGKKIGSVYDLKKDGEYRMSGWEYNARRVYKIEKGLLTAEGPNVIAVRVYDKGLRGGIYEGPVGIMRAENFKKFSRKYYTNQSFWDYVLDLFIIN